MKQTTQNRNPDLRLQANKGSQNEVISMQEEQSDFQELCSSVSTSVTSYSTKHPAVLAGAVFLTGFYLGWKIKPW
jgi:uncharacterized membrane protein (Fun14 family)